VPVVSSLFVYPIKSCKGVACTSLPFDRRGPRLDRRWMLVDLDGKFLTQRQNPRLGRIQPHLSPEDFAREEAQLKVSASGMEDFCPPLEPHSRTEVEVWGFRGPAWDLGDECATWFSDAIGQSCRLVRFADDVQRKTSQRHTRRASEVAFSDGYPVLLLSVESLRELNRRLDEPVPMNRFRPNLVVRDAQPFAEDTWGEVRAPDLTLSVVKPCERCVITTIDQNTLTSDKEPLKTLAGFRRKDGAVVFGQNCVHHGTGTIRVGDALSVFSKPAAEASEQ
jgi:uncharacterized protein YcbX